jgi:hypothetical protein
MKKTELMLDVLGWVEVCHKNGDTFATSDFGVLYTCERLVLEGLIVETYLCKGSKNRSFDLK